MDFKGWRVSWKTGVKDTPTGVKDTPSTGTPDGGKWRMGILVDFYTYESEPSYTDIRALVINPINGKMETVEATDSDRFRVEAIHPDPYYHFRLMLEVLQEASVEMKDTFTTAVEAYNFPIE